MGNIVPGFHQYGFVVRNLEEKVEFYSRHLGLGPWKHLEWNDGNSRVDGVEGPFRFIIAIAMMGDMELELIEPLSGNLLFDEFLSRNDGGIHHMGVRVKELDPMLEKFGALGISPICTGTHIERGVRIAYLDTAPRMGTIVELMERGPLSFD